MISRFLHDIADIPATWTMLNIIEETIDAVRAQVGTDRVICGLSGGVDSSVVAALLHRAIGRPAHVRLRRPRHAAPR